MEHVYQSTPSLDCCCRVSDSHDIGNRGYDKDVFFPYELSVTKKGKLYLFTFFSTFLTKTKTKNKNKKEKKKKTFIYL